MSSYLYPPASPTMLTGSDPSSPILPHIRRRLCVAQHRHKPPRCLHNRLHRVGTVPGSPRCGQLAALIVVEIVVGGFLQYIPDEGPIFPETPLVAAARGPLVSVPITPVQALVLAHDAVVEPRVELLREIMRRFNVDQVGIRGPFEGDGADEVFPVGLDEMGEGVAHAPQQRQARERASRC